MQNKLKANKRVIDDNEEEITKLKNKNRTMQRDLDDLNEQIEMLTKDISTLRKPK